MEGTKRTKNPNLQTQLSRWSELCGEVESMSDPLEKRVKMIEFCRCFVPGDITESEMTEYADSLLGDEELFQATHREIDQCARGIGVETIKGNQKTRAIFTLLPLQETGTSMLFFLDPIVVRRIRYCQRNFIH
jgi:hypothetical protein